MTESEWLGCNDPEPMEKLVIGTASDRRRMLFVCGSYRQVWHLLDQGSRRHVERSECAADGLLPADQRKAAKRAPSREDRVVALPTGWIEALQAAWATAGARRATLVRCIFGNPFRPAALDPAWLAWNGGLIRQLAEVAYHERQLPSGLLDLDRLAVLADALEEASCQDQEILGHLRQPEAVHVRGCHIVDLLLSKE
jgi:hypothetical protein